MKKFLRQNAAIILYNAPLRRYFTNFTSSHGTAVLTQDKTYLLCDDRYLAAAQKKATAETVRYTPTALKELLVKLNIQKAGVVLTHMSAKEYKELEDYSLQLEDVSALVFKQTAVKDNNALNYIKKACNIAEKALKLSLLSLKEGITEKEFARILELKMLNLGADGTAFQTIAAFGKNSCVPHHQTANTKLKENMPVLIDFGCSLNGWKSDMTRTIYFGQPDKEFTNTYLCVLKAHEQAAGFARAGMTGGEVDQIAREVLKTKGLDAYFTHSLGHGLGLEIHEEPFLKKGSEFVIEDGTVFTIEPGVYLNDKFGIRIENTYLIEGGKAKSLMTYTKSPLYIKSGKILPIKHKFS